MNPAYSCSLRVSWQHYIVTMSQPRLCWMPGLESWTWKDKCGVTWCWPGVCCTNWWTQSIHGTTSKAMAQHQRCCYGYQIFLDISHIFFSLYLLDKETQRDTYLNPFSEFTLNFLDSIYSQMTPLRKRSFLLELKPLSSDYALFSSHNRGYADLSKRLWLCMSKHAGVFSHLFLYCFLLKHYIKIHKTLEI